MGEAMLESNNEMDPQIARIIAAKDRKILELDGVIHEIEAERDNERRAGQEELKKLKAWILRELQKEQERLEAQAAGEQRMDDVNLSMAHAEGIASIVDRLDRMGV